MEHTVEWQQGYEDYYAQRGRPNRYTEDQKVEWYAGYNFAYDEDYKKIMEDQK